MSACVNCGLNIFRSCLSVYKQKPGTVSGQGMTDSHTAKCSTVYSFSTSGHFLKKIGLDGINYLLPTLQNLLLIPISTTGVLQIPS